MLLLEANMLLRQLTGSLVLLRSTSSFLMLVQLLAVMLKGLVLHTASMGRSVAI